MRTLPAMMVRVLGLHLRHCPPNASLDMPRCCSPARSSPQGGGLLVLPCVRWGWANRIALTATAGC
jgi:hypothetical protein